MSQIGKNIIDAHIFNLFFIKKVDLLAGNLKYRLHREEARGPVRDSFTFVVRTADQVRRTLFPNSISHVYFVVFILFQKSAEQRFEITYVPGDASVDVVLETLEVEEGGKRPITER